jgi:hypothetical protein
MFVPDVYQSRQNLSVCLIESPTTHEPTNTVTTAWLAHPTGG